ncbi:helix-turn-helix transcriptional regulator [Streptomyces niger]|uniref:helix-turn-helix transcriptional regulator n=1 Tax=Streptomyces niger TaxID=66373 RepID=UPI001F15D127|nr:helix-turn-helix transcriptional regulator [Streptomyces niger]
MTGSQTARSPLRIHGRDTELSTAHTLMSSLAHGTGGALVCAAGPGLGRTAFLERAVQEFRPGRALLVRATAADGARPYGGVRALVHAVTGARPPAGRGRAPERDDLLMSLRPAAADHPLLLCVDDVHLWDTPTLMELGRCARLLRTSPAPVGLLLSVADHRAHDPALAGLPRLRLGPLDGPAAAALLADLTDGRAAPAVRDALARAADGNPRLLRELAAGLTPQQLAGLAPLPRPLADPATLLRAYGARPAELPPDTRRFLLLAAAAQEHHPDGPGADAALVLRAATAAGLGDTAPEPAEAAGLVRIEDDRIHFAGAPLRRALYEGAPLARRRAAHALLASASEGDPGRPLPHLVHRALAADGPAPALAARLAGAAQAEGTYLSHEERAVALAVAARLTEDDTERATRLTEAADHARLAGRHAHARELLAPVRALPAALPVRGRAELVHGLLSLRDGPVADAREELLLAAALLGPHDPAATLTARLAATEAAWAMGDAAAYVEALGDAPDEKEKEEGEGGGGGGGDAGGGVFGRLPEDYRIGMAAVLSGRLDAGVGPLRRLLARTDQAAAPEVLLRAGVAALIVGDLAAACRINARALASARALGRTTLVPQALEHLAYGELRAGRHPRARVHAEEGLRTAYRTGQRNIAAHQHAILALVASVEGDTDALTAHASAAGAVAAPHGLVQVLTLTGWALARADLGAGRVDEAAARLGPLVRPGPRQGHFAVRMLAVPCYAEAAVQAGAPDAARAAVEEFAVWADLGADPAAPAQLARCRALLAGAGAGGGRVAAADAYYEEARARHEDTVNDFERARTLLLHGKWLRRRRRPGPARGLLRDALVAFEGCGARAWTEQARAELRATGDAPAGAEPPAPGRPGPLADLTPQQLRIARCVAEGATNREVALRLSVSPRTVDHHLRNVFAVLGVRSRLELARLVDRAGGSAAPR